MTPSRTPRVPNIGLNSCQACAARRSACSSSARPSVACLMSSSSVRGRNSCKGGSRRRTVTGRPSIASRISMKSAFCATRSSSSAAVSASGVSAKIMRRTIGSRSSPRNMCSVRHRPIPSAPNWRALAASGPLSALARTASLPLRMASAQLRMTANSGGGSAVDSCTSPRTTSPLVPSMEIMSPSWTVTSPAVNDLPSILMDSAPTTAGLPHPRATTAAWLTRARRAR